MCESDARTSPFWISPLFVPDVVINGCGSALEDDDARNLNRNVFFFGFIFQLSGLKESFLRSVKLLFFLYHFFFLCGHGDVSSFSCSVLKEEATFLSCETFPLCGKSRSLFFY